MSRFYGNQKADPFVPPPWNHEEREEIEGVDSPFDSVDVFRQVAIRLKLESTLEQAIGFFHSTS